MEEIAVVFEIVISIGMMEAVFKDTKHDICIVFHLSLHVITVGTIDGENGVC